MADREAAIIAQVAVKAAVDLMGPGAASQLDEDQLLGAIRSIASGINKIVYEVANSSAVAVPPEAPIVAAFPGAQVQQINPNPQPQPAAPFAQNVLPIGGQASPVQGQSAIGPHSTREDLWMNLCTHPNDWEDRRQTKTADEQPDFAHRFIQGNNGRNLALWTHYQGRLVVPEFARAQLGYAG